MSLINQPRIQVSGVMLPTLLSGKEDFTNHTFFIMVAYAKRSGISRLRETLDQYRRKGGKLVAIVGVDQKTTSIQGVQLLLELSDELYVFHSESFSQTFHPKVYVLEHHDIDASVIIGSGNLTAGGLYTNYEAFYEKKYNLVEASDAAEYSHVMAMINSYKDITSPCCRLVTTELFNDLVRLGYLSNEEIISGVSEREVVTGETVSRLFGDETFIPPPVRITAVEPKVQVVKVPSAQFTGLGFWKKLSRYDVSTTSSPGQIIIPLRFLSIFPNFTDWKTTNSGAKQANVYFNIIFRDPNGSLSRLDSVRAILYVPAPHHPRPNQELRFTFRNVGIFGTLQKNDVLVFRCTDNHDILFEINHVRPDSDEYRVLGCETKKFELISIHQ